jgi:endonuclease YncB( thermonuclease family)
MGRVSRFGQPKRPIDRPYIHRRKSVPSRRSRVGGLLQNPWEPLAMIFAAVAVIYIGAQYLATDGLPALARTQQAGEAVSASFGVCNGSVRFTCVVDGDTIWLKGTKIRIADIDTPEVLSPKCASESALGNVATQRLTVLLNAGPFEVASINRDEDVYGRKLRILMRNGQSIGETLVAEGLAHRWDGAQHSWCG